MPCVGSGATGLLGHRQDDDRDPERPDSWICSTSVEALDPALEQRVDEDDVRPQLLIEGGPSSRR